MKKRKRFLTALMTVFAGVFLAATMLPAPDMHFFTSRPIIARNDVSSGNFTPLQLTGVPFLGGGLFNAKTPVYGMSVGGSKH